MMRGGFKLLWYLVLQPLAKTLGLRSLNALAACQKMLQIVLFGAADELLVPFIIDWMATNNTIPSIHDFYGYI